MTTSRPGGRSLGLLLVALLSVQAFQAPLTLCADPGHASDEVIASVRRNASGWGLRTPLLLTGAAVAQQVLDKARHDAPLDPSRWFDYAKEPMFWRGLGGDLVTVAAAALVAPMLPGGTVVRTLLLNGAAYAGWEAGTGNLRGADWTSIGVQVAVSTAVQLGTTALLAALGVPWAGALATVPAMASALTVAWLLERWRGRHGVATAPERLDDPLEARPWPDAPAEAAPAAPGGDPTELARQKDEAYRLFVGASGTGREDEQARSLRRYREADARLAAVKAAPGARTDGGARPR